MLAKRLQPGDTIGVIAPDKALNGKDHPYFKNATHFFEGLGLKVKYGKYIFSDTNYCAGTPQQRAADLNDMFADKDVKAIFTAKGGDLANGILPFIDFDNIKRNPKIFLGYSDITVLLCAINKMTGLVTFHCQDYIWFGKDDATDYDRNEITNKLFNGDQTIIPYDARQFYNFSNQPITGKIYGTNVRCLLKLVGTPYLPNLSNAIMFLEGYRSDILQWNTMLTQYDQMGALGKAVVFGYIYQLQFEEKDQHDIVKELRAINTAVPVVKTNDFGHHHSSSIIPIGADATLDPASQTITLGDYLW